MAQPAEADIYLGSNRTVGRLHVDAGMIRSEAGPLEPRLIMPVAIEFSNRPSDQMLALTHLVGDLHIGDENNTSTEVGTAARLDLIPGFHARSLPEGHSKFNAELRFQLNPIAVQRIEAARHLSAASLFELRIRCEGVVAWIRKTRGEMQPSRGRAGKVDTSDPFKLQFGLALPSQKEQDEIIRRVAKLEALADDVLVRIDNATRSLSDCASATVEAAFGGRQVRCDSDRADHHQTPL